MTSTNTDQQLVAGGAVSSRRNPYPYDVRLNGTGLRLREGVMGKRVLPMENYQATVQEYGTDDLYLERSYTFRRAYSGMGDSTQQGNGTPSRYAYGRNCWTFGAYRGLGPRWHAVVPPAAEGPVAGIVEAPHTDGQLALFVLAGRYVRRWDGDTGAEQSLSLDLGAGVRAETWTRWEANTPGGPAYAALYLTDSSSRLWRYQAGGWTQLSGAPTASFICATGVELWRGAGNDVSKCEGDPNVPGSWTAPIPVGDPEVPLSGLGQLAGRLFIFKQDGTVWALQGGADVGRARNLAPGLATTPTPENGRRPVAWDGGLFFRVDTSLWKLTAGGDGTTFDRMGPERLVDNTSPVRGPVVSFAGDGAWGAYGCLYNATVDGSYLCGHGNWVPADPASPDAGTFAFVPAWNGSLLDLAGKRATGMGITRLARVVGAPAPATPWAAGDRGNPYLVVGFSDGTYGFVKLPREGANPFGPGAHLAWADLTDQESWLRWPRHSLMAPGDYKAYLSFAATGPVLDATRAMRPEYRIDPVGPNAPWQPLSQPLIESGSRVLFPDDTWGRIIDVREVFVRAGSTGPPTPAAPGESPGPVIASLTLREQLRPAFRMEYAGTVMAHHRVARRDGGTCRLMPWQIRNAIVEAAQEPGHVVLTMPDETAGRFALIQYQEQIPADGRGRRRGIAWDIALSAIQYRTQSVFGVFGRLNLTKFGDLDTATFGDLSEW